MDKDQVETRSSGGRRTRPPRDDGWEEARDPPYYWVLVFRPKRDEQTNAAARPRRAAVDEDLLDE